MSVGVLKKGSEEAHNRAISFMVTSDLILIIALLGFVFALLRTGIAFRKWTWKRADRRNHEQDNKMLYTLAQIKQILERIERKM